MIHIFIPFWGRPDYLYSAVRSVQAQTVGSWRLTVVDDCYPEDVSGFFDALDDPRVEYLRNSENLGIIKNFAKCQSLSEGEYTVFMGCDDLLLPNYVELIEQVAREFPGVEVIQPGVEVIDEEGKTHRPLADRVKDLIRPRGSATQLLAGEPLAQSLLLGDWLYWPSLAFRTEALRKVEFLPDFQIILDLALILDLVQMGSRLALTSEVAFQYRRHAASLSSTALVDGPRFADEKRFFTQRSEMLRASGWRRAARSAKLHLTSRGYALTMLPGALGSRQGTSALLRHVFR